MIGSVDDVIQHIKRREMIHILKIQTTILKAITDFMVSRGFIQLMPVITSKITDPLGPDPGSMVKFTPVIRYYDEDLVLTQSMIIHKQLSLLTGVDKIFIMSPNIRLEDESRRNTGKHLFEFTQMDFEIAYGSMKDVMTLVEDLLVEVLNSVSRENSEDLEALGRRIRIPGKPFPLYTTHELEEKYGSDWEIKASLDHVEPFWAICFRREFYDREDPKNPGHYRNYDLIYPEGYGEALSGGEREYEYERIMNRIKHDGLNPSRFESFLEIARRGLLIPSAGAGLGVERLVKFIAGAKHIGDVQLFRRVPGEKVII